MRVTNPLKWLLVDFCGVLYIWGLRKLGQWDEEYHILVLKYIGFVEANRIVTMASKSMEKLRFGIGTMP
jgi:hypothetical protein